MKTPWRSPVASMAHCKRTRTGLADWYESTSQRRRAEQALPPGGIYLPLVQSRARVSLAYNSIIVYMLPGFIVADGSPWGNPAPRHQATLDEIKKRFATNAWRYEWNAAVQRGIRLIQLRNNHPVEDSDNTLPPFTCQCRQNPYRLTRWNGVSWECHVTLFLTDASYTPTHLFGTALYDSQ